MVRSLEGALLEAGSLEEALLEAAAYETESLEEEFLEAAVLEERCTTPSQSAVARPRPGRP